MNEATRIAADNKAISLQQREIAKLDAATSARVRPDRSASRSTRTNDQIVDMTAKLVLLSTQAYNTAVNLSPSNSGLVSQALFNLLTVQNISAQVGLGIAPATPSQ